MFRIVALILLGFPALELAFTLWVGSLVGPWIWLWLLGGLLTGMLMLRGQKFGAPLLILQSLRNGDPLGGVIWNLRIALAAVLFIVPGLLSDLFGMILLLPWQPKIATVRVTPRDDVIDGEFRRVDDDHRQIGQ